MGQKISKEQRDRFLAAWNEAVRGRFNHDYCTVQRYDVVVAELSAAQRPLGIAFMYPGLVAEGL